MTQTRPHPTTILSRTFGRGGRAPSRSRPRFNVPFDWRRALSLYRRLLAGDLSVMREVSRTEADTAPALAVLVVGTLAAGLGAWIWFMLDSGLVGHSAVRVFALGSLGALVGWAIWLAVAWRALQSIFALQVDLHELGRAFALVGGFAVWQFFMLAGPISFAIGLIVMVASVLLAVAAVRAAAPGADNRAAVISVGIGFSAHALVLSLLADLAGVGSGLFVHAIG